MQLWQVLADGFTAPALLARVAPGTLAPAAIHVPVGQGDLSADQRAENWGRCVEALLNAVPDFDFGIESADSTSTSTSTLIDALVSGNGEAVRTVVRGIIEADLRLVRGRDLEDDGGT